MVRTRVEPMSYCFVSDALATDIIGLCYLFKMWVGDCLHNNIYISVVISLK